MNILISNDDGYDSEGLKILAECLAEKNNVYVVAPDGNRSAVSNCITMFNSTRIKIISDKVWACSGVPADCAAIGIQSDLIDVKIDAVVAGINFGPNLGTDIVYSGTCAVARQAVLNGVPGIAVSLDPVDWSKSYEEKFKFNALADFVAKNIENLVKLARIENPRAFVNINAASLDSYRGVKFTSKLCNREYNDRIKIHIESENDLKSEFVPGNEEKKIDSESDFGLCRAGYIVISRVLAEPVCLDVVDGINFSL